MEMLSKYTKRGSFNFYLRETRQDCFEECNAPSNASGIYLIYGINGTREELVYIGISGKIDKTTGNFEHRADGIKGRLISGKHRYDNTRKVTRYTFWKEMMVADGFKKLRIDWFITHDKDKFQDNTKPLEDALTAMYKPRWDSVNRY
jgi:hypothetical protein